MNPTAIALATGHANLSPSSAHRWSVCTAAPNEEAGKPDDAGEAADWGTAAHFISALCLDSGADPWSYLGRVVAFVEGGREVFEEDVPADAVVVRRIDADKSLIGCCASYVGFIRELMKMIGGTLLVEQRVPIGWITGEDGAGGTSDCVILAGDELIIVDLKGGMNQVDAFHVVHIGEDPLTGLPITLEIPKTVPNKQLAMYAAGALREFGWMADIKRVRMIICQPRLSHVSEHAMTVDELGAFIAELSLAAAETRTNPTYRPGDNTCTYCKAKSTCKALEKYVFDAVFGEFDDLTAAPLREYEGPALGVIYEKLDLIVGWCEAKRTLVRQELEAGRPVVGKHEAYKLVEGKMGARYWNDPTKAEKALKSMLRNETHIYKRELISPTGAEELAESGVLGERQWKKLQELVGQNRNKPSIVPASHRKPALTNTIDEFDDLTVSQPTADCADLF